jgi:hypothetical protein
MIGLHGSHTGQLNPLLYLICAYTVKAITRRSKFAKVTIGRNGMVKWIEIGSGEDVQVLVRLIKVAP